MAVETRLTFIDVSRHALMLFIHVWLIVLMTINAGEARVVSPDMTVGARIPGALMRARVNREILAIVIEYGPLPGNSGMTQLALRRETCLLVIGIHSVQIVALMAEIAGGGSPGVLAIRMTEGTGRVDMSPRQRVARLRVMIETGGRPGRRIVAFRADVAERRRRMDRVGSSAEVALVAGIAVIGRSAINPIRVAQTAIYGCVSPRQRVTRLGIMVEARWRPGCGVVASRADQTEGRRRVDRIRGGGETFMMAGVTFGRRAVVPLAVAILTTRIGMRTGQGKIGGIMVKAGIIPGAGIVADFAFRGVVAGNVIGIGCVHKILLMTRYALGRRARVALGMTNVAVFFVISARSRCIVRRCVSRRHPIFDNTFVTMHVVFGVIAHVDGDIYWTGWIFRTFAAPEERYGSPQEEQTRQADAHS